MACQKQTFAYFEAKHQWRRNKSFITPIPRRFGRAGSSPFVPTATSISIPESSGSGNTKRRRSTDETRKFIQNESWMRRWGVILTCPELCAEIHRCLNQRTLTKWEGSVQLTSSLCFCQKNIVCFLKTSSYKLISARRSTVLSFPLQ